MSDLVLRMICQEETRKEKGQNRDMILNNPEDEVQHMDEGMTGTEVDPQ